jgi:hypothetical protein
MLLLCNTCRKLLEKVNLLHCVVGHLGSLFGLSPGACNMGAVACFHASAALPAVKMAAAVRVPTRNRERSTRADIDKLDAYYRERGMLSGPAASSSSVGAGGRGCQHSLCCSSRRDDWCAASASASASKGAHLAAPALSGASIAIWGLMYSIRLLSMQCNDLFVS